MSLGSFLIFNLSIPLVLRFSKNFWRGLFEDLFIVLQLFAFSFLSLELTAIAGLFIHLFLILDRFLYRQMGLRMRFSYLYHLGHLKTLIPSAKALGLHRFLTLSSLVLIGHVCGYFFLYRHFDPTISGTVASLIIIALLGVVCFPSSYASYNPFFEVQKKLLILKRRKKGASPSFPPSDTRLFSLKIDPAEKPHIIVLFLESFGSKAAKIAAPHFNKLAKDGILFSQFYANGTLTYRALLAGIFGTPPGSTTQGLLPYLNFPFEGLPSELKEAGYTTAFFHNGSLSYDRQAEFLEKHYDLVIDRKGIEEGPFDKKSWGAPDEDLMRYTAAWLGTQKEPAFLTLFTMTNHHPWIVPEHHQPAAFEGPLLQRKYLETTHYSDTALQLLIDLLKEKNLSQNTLLFIVGDHGQPMGEHYGNFYNSRFLYEENIHVPLLILAEGRIDHPQIISEIGSHLDLVPTILDLLHLPHQGSSLLRKYQNKTVFFQNPYSEGFFGCRKNEWKWIGPAGELYDLSRDPAEKNNLAKEHPASARALQEETENYFAHLDQLYETKNTLAIKSERDLDFSNTLITDQELIASLSPAIERLNLQDCLLLTDIAIREVFAKCPHLEELNLKGVTDLTDAAFKNPPPSLRNLDLSDAAQITNLSALGSISHLAIHSQSMTSQSIAALGPALTRLKIFHAPHVTDDVLIQLFQNNLHLGRLVLENCPLLTDQILFALQKHPLELLWIIDNPQITDKGVASLAHLPLHSLKLENCPRLTDKCKIHLQNLTSYFVG